MPDTQEDCTLKIDADTSAAKRELEALEQTGKDFAKTLTGAFEGLVLKGRSFGEVVRGLRQELAKIAFKAAFKPLQDKLGESFGGLFKDIFGNAKVATAQAGRGGASPVPFARGGVVSSPTYFPLAGGRSGVMGEGGAEVILPLRRGADGRLGVSAEAGGGVAITFNVTTPDAESFARSETQLSAMLSRAVARGQRNL